MRMLSFELTNRDLSRSIAGALASQQRPHLRVYRTHPTHARQHWWWAGMSHTTRFVSLPRQPHGARIELTMVTFALLLRVSPAASKHADGCQMSWPACHAHQPPRARPTRTCSPPQSRGLCSCDDAVELEHRKQPRSTPPIVETPAQACSHASRTGLLQPPLCVASEDHPPPLLLCMPQTSASRWLASVLHARGGGEEGRGVHDVMPG